MLTVTRQCCTLLYVNSSIAIILVGKRELVALLNLSSLCLVMVEWLFLAGAMGCLWFVIVVYPDHTHLLFFFCGSFMLFVFLCHTVVPVFTALRLPVRKGLTFWFSCM